MWTNKKCNQQMHRTGFNGIQDKEVTTDVACGFSCEYNRNDLIVCNPSAVACLGADIDAETVAILKHY